MDYRNYNIPDDLLKHWLFYSTRIENIRTAPNLLPKSYLLGKGFSYAVKGRAFHHAYMALALRRLPRIFLDIYIYIHARGNLDFNSARYVVLPSLAHF